MAVSTAKPSRGRSRATHAGYPAHPLPDAPEQFPRRATRAGYPAGSLMGSPVGSPERKTVPRRPAVFSFFLLFQ